jgi:RNA polymerase subunit RPABC4/transcription elongation factor Spt4
MPPALCAHCGALVSVNALICPNCRHRSLGQISRSRSGLFRVSPDALSRFANRVAIMILIGIVTLTWFAIVEWSKDSHEVRDSFEAQIQCEIILEHGEEYEGELAACRRQVAYLRAMEHK